MKIKQWSTALVMVKSCLLLDSLLFRNKPGLCWAKIISNWDIALIQFVALN